MDIINSLQSIGFDWQLAVAHLINFMIVVGLLNYFVFDPLRETLKERRSTIEKGVADAQAAEKERQSAEENRQRIITEAKKERQEIINEARDTAEKIEADAKDEAQHEADEIIAAGRKKVASEKASMQQELKGKIGGLAVKAAEKIIDREITDNDHDALVDDVIKTAQHD